MANITNDYVITTPSIEIVANITVTNGGSLSVPNPDIILIGDLTISDGSLNITGGLVVNGTPKSLSLFFLQLAS